MTIERNGITIELTEAEKEAVFREVEHKYRLNDARCHLDELSETLEEDGSSLRETYGVHFTSVIDNASDNYALENIIKEYEKHLDCNIDDNTTWRNAVEMVMRRFKEPYKSKAITELALVFDEQRSCGVSVESILGIVSIDDLISKESSPEYIVDDIISYFCKFVDEENMDEKMAWYNACYKALEAFKKKGDNNE